LTFAHRNILLFLGAALLLLQAIGLYLQHLASFHGVVGVALAEGAIYLLAVASLRRAATMRRGLPFILLVAALLRVGTVMFPPFLSSDMYRYVWDGRVQGAGINPYRYLPADQALSRLRDEAIYPNINRSDYARTIYPPMAQLIFLAVTRAGDGVLAMKLAMLGFDLAAIFLLLMLLRGSGAPPEQILIYAWHPLTVWEIAGSGHVDAVVVALLTLALLARQRKLAGLAGFALASATLVKYFPAALFPALYRRWDWRMPAAFAVTVAALYIPYLSVGWGVLGYLPNYASEERLASGSGFYLLGLLSHVTGQPHLSATAYIAVVGSIMCGLAAFVFFRRQRTANDYIVASLMLSTTTFVLLTPHYPWYFLWLLPMLCIVPNWPALILTAVSFVLYIGLQYQHPALELLIKVSPFAIFLLAVVIEQYARRRRRRTSPLVPPGAEAT
jgi:hypothetical protein